MGAFNYGSLTSDSNLVIGFNTYEYDYIDYEVYQQLENIIKEQSLYHFDIELKSGYYNGAYIQIKNNLPWVYDNYIELKEALTECRILQDLILEVVNNYDLIGYMNGWVIGLLEHKEVIKVINKVFTSIRKEIKNTLTLNQYDKLNDEDKKFYYNFDLIYNKSNMDTIKYNKIINTFKKVVKKVAQCL